MSSFKKVVRHVKQERERQDSMWGGPKHDDEHTSNEWLAFIEDQAKDAGKAKLKERYRMGLVKVAALAVAAIQSFDRKQEDEEDT